MAVTDLLVSQKFLSSCRALWSRDETVIFTPPLPLCRPCPTSSRNYKPEFQNGMPLSTWQGVWLFKIDSEVEKNSECFLRRADLLSCHLLWIKAVRRTSLGMRCGPESREPLLPGNKICVSKEIQQKGECFKSQRLSECKSIYVQKGK